jgi:membrane fusion protein, multidrug efflux system
MPVTKLERSTPWLALMLVIGALALTACSDSPATVVPQDDAPVRQVRLAAAVRTEAARVVGASGTLAADDQIILGTKVVGRLAEISVDLGSRVKKGQSLARIDPSDYRLRVEQAEAAL